MFQVKLYTCLNVIWRKRLDCNLCKVLEWSWWDLTCLLLMACDQLYRRVKQHGRQCVVSPWAWPQAGKQELSCIPAHSAVPVLWNLVYLAGNKLSASFYEKQRMASVLVCYEIAGSFINNFANNFTVLKWWSCMSISPVRSGFWATAPYLSCGRKIGKTCSH